jgi:hypothetical protein
MEKNKQFFLILSSILIIILLSYSINHYISFTGKIVSVRTSAVIDTGIKVLYATFDGDTTDFNILTDAELATLSNMTLERTTLGKIIFGNTIDLTQDADAENVVDLDSNVNISYNYVKINTTRLTSLDDLAVISVYNVFVQNPRVLKDKTGCPSYICNVIGYSNVTGKVVFTVAYFDNSAYSINETPESVEVSVPGGGGGGGGGAVTKPIDENKKVLLEIAVPPSQTLFSGEEKNILVRLLNKGDFQLSGIQLDAETNAPDVSLSLSKTLIKSIEIGKEDFFVLNLKSLTDSKAHIGLNNYYITLTATVGGFNYEASAKFFITLKEANYETRIEAVKQMQFADDLFMEEPRCQEYQYKIDQAKKLYDESDYLGVLSLLDSAIQSCRDVISGGEEAQKEYTGVRKTGMAYLYGRITSSTPLFYTLLFIIIISILLLVLTMIHYSQRKIIKKHTKQIIDYHSRFEQLLQTINDLILNGDLTNAKKEYAKLCTIYDQIRESSISNAEKTGYYTKLSAIYSELYKIIYRYQR